MPKRIKNCPVIGCDKSGCRSYDGVPYCGTHGSKARYNGCHINSDGTLSIEYECAKCGELVVNPKRKSKLCYLCSFKFQEELRVEKYSDIACQYCGKKVDSTSGRKDKRYCNKECRRLARNTRKQPSLRQYECTWCGIAYKSRVSGSKTCGDECAWYCKRYFRHHKGVTSPWSPPLSTALAVPVQPWKVFQLIESFQPDSKAGVIYSKQCEECGSYFLNRRQSRYCSDKCAAKAYKQVRRARQRSAYRENVYRWKIYKRDKFRCKICGKQVKYSKKTDDNDPRAATIDHIIPLCQGGTHEMKNVQTACRECNSRKSGNSANDQLLLFG